MDEGVGDEWDTEAVGEVFPRTRRKRGIMIWDSSEGPEEEEELELDES
jgi:hypothetical protein